MTCCWDTIMNVLAVPLQFDLSNDSKNLPVKKILRNELNKDSIRQMSVQHSLDALQKAATLANILGTYVLNLNFLTVLNFQYVFISKL